MQIDIIPAMSLAWLVECKTCLQRFAVKKRELVAGKATDTIEPNLPVGEFECPHCHEVHRYTTSDYIPGEGRIHSH
ncbi:MAG TPA: hypothetical protein VN577_19500 [Terriglobales bacterium]|nr:hypothetical protein [Terriglobales bacterium]